MYTEGLDFNIGTYMYALTSLKTSGIYPVHETVGHDQVAHKIGCLCISL